MNFCKKIVNKDGLCMIVHDVQDMLVGDVRKGGTKMWMFKHRYKALELLLLQKWKEPLWDSEIWGVSWPRREKTITGCEGCLG